MLNSDLLKTVKIAGKVVNVVHDNNGDLHLDDKDVNDLIGLSLSATNLFNSSSNQQSKPFKGNDYVTKQVEKCGKNLPMVLLDKAVAFWLHHALKGNKAAETLVTAYVSGELTRLLKGEDKKSNDTLLK